jgi:adenylate cyclase
MGTVLQWPVNRHRVNPALITVKRRLCVIAFADVANWTRLVEHDDVRAWRDWRVLLAKVIEPALYEHGGRLLEVVGDAAMSEFDSAHGALSWAIHTQRQCHRIAECLPAGRSPIRLRIGVHLAEVIVDGGRRVGHGVNVAARIHQWAEPGEIIASRSIVELLSGRLAGQWDHLGERALKNLSQQVHLARFVPDPEPCLEPE